MPANFGQTPTIRDVAKLCGVGTTTVSRAFNNQPEVSAQTRARVLEVAKQIGYQPNPHARVLKATESRTIAVLIKGLENPFFVPILTTLENQIRRHDYVFSLVNVGIDADEVDVSLRLLTQSKVAGIVFVGANLRHSEPLIHNLNVPFALLTMGDLVGVDRARYSSVRVDDQDESAALVEYLIELGHRRIAVIGNPASDESVGRLRIGGYRRALDLHGLDFDPRLLRDGRELGLAPFSYEQGYVLARDLVRFDQRVTAIFCQSDVIAIGALRALADEGLRVPHDVSVVGFDGIEAARYHYPSLTTVIQPLSQMAQVVFELLLDSITTGRSGQHRVFPASLSVGESTGPVRGALAAAGHATQASGGAVS